MDSKNNSKYKRAKKKVEALKGLYGHAAVYFILNGFMILFNANVFNSHVVNFSGIGTYFTAIMWGIGLFFHAFFVLMCFNFNSDFIRRWEEKKIQKILDEDN